MKCSLCGVVHGFFEICADQRLLNLAVLVAVKEGQNVSSLLTLFR